MNYSKIYDLQPGDRIIEPLFQTGFSKHHAIYLGPDVYGNELIAENHKLKGVQIIKAIEYFATVKRVERIEKFTGDNEQRKQVIHRALRLAGKPYDLINYNCEHFANEVQHGKIESKQVNNFMNGLKIFVAAFMLFKLFDVEF